MTPFVIFDLDLGSLLLYSKTDDFCYQDLYSKAIKIKSDEGISSISKDMIIVNIDGCPRERIPSIIDSIYKKGASVIGIDIIFKTRDSSDSLLIENIHNASAKTKIVLAATVDEGYEESNPLFIIADKPWFYDSSCGATLGAINFGAIPIHGVVRSFKPSFFLGNKENENINQFSVEIVKQYSPKAFDKLMRKEDNYVETINYHQNDIAVFSWNELLDNNKVDSKKHKVDLKHKIVLIGYTEDTNDLKRTPIGDMAGIRIHAAIAQMILDNSYITSSSPILNKLTAIIISFIFVWILLFLTKFPNIGNLIG